MNTGHVWCNKYDSVRFLREGMTSRNTEIDKLIYDAQLQIRNYFNKNNLKVIKMMARL